MNRRNFIVTLSQATAVAAVPGTALAAGAFTNKTVSPGQGTIMIGGRPVTFDSLDYRVEGEGSRVVAIVPEANGTSHLSVVWATPYPIKHHGDRTAMAEFPVDTPLGRHPNARVVHVLGKVVSP
jgi:hypothetical protein